MKYIWKLIRWIMGHRILYIPKPVNGIFYPEYGLLYNWYAATDSRNIAASGWHLPTGTELTTLQSYLGGSSFAGGKLKETGLIYWYPANQGATNETNFNGRGCGQRNVAFDGLQNNGFIGTVTSGYPALYTIGVLYHSSAYFIIASGSYYKYNGSSIRLIKDTTSLSDGESGTYTGNDSKVYRTICIGTQEWLADNLSETRFRNGDIIPWYGADSANYFTDAEWAALTTAGCCAYNNTLSNVATGFTFPT